MVKVLENVFMGIICSFAVNNWSNLWRYWNQMIAYLTIFVLPEGTPQGTHTVCVCVCECVCKRLLFCSKCTGFTVRLTYNDISLSMYINQCEINLELPYLWYIVVLFIPQKRFWANLKDFEFAIYCKRRTQNSSESLKKTLLRQKDDKSTCMVLQINVVVVVLIVYVIKVTYIFVSVEGLRSNMKYINFFFRISM